MSIKNKNIMTLEMANNNQIKILFIEDIPSDVELAVLELKKENIKFEYFTVCTRIDLLKALKEFKPDLIISDYQMPSFNGLQALKESKSFNPDIPFILYTGSVNEETAVQCIKEGADDYVIKEHLTRLPFAVKEALMQATVRKEKIASDLLLKDSEEKLQSIFSAAPVGIGLVVKRIIIEANDTLCSMSGYSRSELIGKSSRIFYPSDAEYEYVGDEKYRQISEIGIGTIETRIKRKDGKILNIILSSTPLDFNDLTKGVTFTMLDVTVMKKAEEQLKNSEERFRSIAENLSDIIFITDSEGVIKYISPAVKFVGYEQEDCIGKFFGDFIPVSELDKARSAFVNAINSINLRSSVSILFRRKDSSVFYAELSGSPFRFSDSSVGVLGLLRDITDKVIRENELRKLSQAVEQNPISVVITNTEGVIEYINPKFCEVTGYTKEELLGNNPRILKSGDKTKEEYKQLWDTIISGNDWKGEFRNKKKNGELYWENASISPIIDDKNEITHFIGIKEEISDRKRSEQIQKALFVISNAVVAGNDLKVLIEIIREQIGTVIDSRNFFLALYNEVTGMLSSPIVYDEKDDFTEWPAYKSLTGYVIEQRKPILLKREDINELNRKGIIDLIGTTSECWLGVPLIVGDEVNGAFVIQNYENPNAYTTKDLDMLSFIANQISQSIQRQQAIIDLKEALLKAEAGDKLKTSFLNNISHEVRTPLNGILGFAEIMTQSDLSSEDRSTSNSMLQESSERLLNTITNYMDISLITSGSLAINKKLFSPVQILKSNYENYKEKCSKKGLKLIIEIPENFENIMLLSDPELINKVISHLLNNAVKFTHVGFVKIGVSISDKDLKFYVKDSGIGIGKKSQKIIFDTFVKEEKEYQSLSEGSGLGLSISKGLTSLLGGILQVESELGAGSSFYFTIPAEHDASSSQSDHNIVENKEKSDKYSILVAEDDETNFFYLNALLKKETEADILHASNGREAIEIFNRNSDIQLILMDVKMPEIDGLEATREIKRINSKIPVIAITAYAMSGDEERIMNAGCDGYLSKPITKSSLLTKISEFIKI